MKNTFPLYTLTLCSWPGEPTRSGANGSLAHTPAYENNRPVRQFLADGPGPHQQLTRLCRRSAAVGRADLWPVHARQHALGEEQTHRPDAGGVRGAEEFVPERHHRQAYRLRIDPKRIYLTAATTAGALRGIQTLLQLAGLQPDNRQLPALELEDHPRFGYRGMHLDVSRHFFDLNL